MNSFQIFLPMPHEKLSPNSKCHWGTKAKYVKQHRLRSYITMKNHIPLPFKVKAYQIHFCFPNKIRRDIDNFTARCKSYLDGIADALGQDDSEWDMKAPTREIVKGDSYICITLTE